MKKVVSGARPLRASLRQRLVLLKKALEHGMANQGLLSRFRSFFMNPPALIRGQS